MIERNGTKTLSQRNILNSSMFTLFFVAITFSIVFNGKMLWNAKNNRFAFKSALLFPTATATAIKLYIRRINGVKNQFVWGYLVCWNSPRAIRLTDMFKLYTPKQCLLAELNNLMEFIASLIVPHLIPLNDSHHTQSMLYLNKIIQHH